MRKNRFIALLVWPWLGWLACLAANPAESPSAANGPVSTTAARPWRLLFSGPGDVQDAWGKLHFGMTPVRLLREIQPPPFVIVGYFPRSDGSWEVYGHQMTEVSRGKEVFETVMTWRLLRTTTRDGIQFEPATTVFEAPAAPWTDHCVMARHPETGEYLLLRLKMDSSGFAYTAFLSSNGLRWQEYEGNPLFYEGDAMSLFWSEALRRFVVVSKSLQPYRKHLRDHGGTTPALGDDSLRDRRVLMIRSSPDGRHWEPSISLSDVWNRNKRKAALPQGLLTRPDAEDPPDLEFYSGNGFWYYDRAYMMVLNYAASPLAPRKHGPQLDNEWWTSPDGLRWERPARGLNALDAGQPVPRSRLETHPLIAGGQILFHRGPLLLGLPEDRISYVSARANGEFSTRLFTMPAAELLLNAAIPGPERPFAKEQAYVMVSLLDEKGLPITGCEPEKCLFRETDRPDLSLRWGEFSPRALAGKKVQLRFFLRSANIYAVREDPGASK